MIKKILLVSHTHTDIGYTEKAHKVMAMQVKYLRRAIELCEETRHNPAGEQYKWIIESMIVVKHFLDQANEAEKTKLFELVREGRIELTGYTTQSQTQLLNAQELDEELRFPRELAQKEGLPLDTMILDDIGGLSWNLPLYMNRSNIKYYIMGVGGWRVLTPIAPLPHLFRYRGIDGSSSCLIYQLGVSKDGVPPKSNFLFAQYGLGIIYLIFPFRKLPIGGDLSGASQALGGFQGFADFLKRIESEGYPYDTILIQNGSDNAGLCEDTLGAVRAWNLIHPELPMQIGTSREFFEDIEKRYGDAIPEIKGEITCTWSEHTLSQGDGTGILQEANRLLNRADLLVNFVRLDTDKRELFLQYRDESLKNALLFKDHTFGIKQWGFHQSMASNHRLHTGGRVVDYARHTWENKRNYAIQARYNAEKMLELIDTQVILNSPNPLDTNNSFCKPDSLNCFITFANPLPYDLKNVLATFHGEELDNIKLKITGKEYYPDYESVNSYSGDYTVLIENFPANSLIGAEIVPTKDSSNEKSPFSVVHSASEVLIKWSNCSLAISRKSGKINSYKCNEVEIQAEDDEFSLNDFAHYEVERIEPSPQSMGLAENPIFTRIKLSSAEVSVNFIGRYFMHVQIIRYYGSKERTIRVESEIELRKNDPALYFRNRVRKVHYEAQEAGYFVFPVKVSPKTWEFKVNAQGYIHDFLKEKLPGAAHQNFAMQSFAVIGDKSQGAMVSSKHSVMMSLGKHPKYYNMQLKYNRDEKPYLFMYCYNNLWSTNAAVEQPGGDLYFDYVLYPLDSGMVKDPAILQSISKSELNPIVTLPGKITQEPDSVKIERPEIDYYFTFNTDHNKRSLNLINLSRNIIETKLTFNGKIQNLKFGGGQLITIEDEKW